MTDTARLPLTAALRDLRIDGPRLIERLESLARLGGISHDPAEWTRPEDLVAAADTLLHVLLELSEGDHLAA
jgi:hypothetical protein